MFSMRRSAKKQRFRYEPGVVFWELPPRRTFAQDLALLAVWAGLTLALLAAVLCVVLIPDLGVHAWIPSLLGR